MGNNNILENDIEEVLLSEEELDSITTRLGQQISKDYEGKKLILVSVLKGSVVFMGDLMRKITIPCCIDFMSVSSYGNSTHSTGVVKIIKDLDTNVIEGSNLLIVEDILDSGRTLSYLKDILERRRPESIRICTLLDKPDRRAKDVTLKPDYVGATIPDAFVVGYGLDFAELYRNLPFVGIVKDEAVKRIKKEIEELEKD